MVATQARAKLLQRLREKANKTVCANEIGDFQFCVLTAVRVLSPKATINEVIDMIIEETEDVPDVAQVYIAFRAFKDEKRKWIRETGAKESSDGGRPQPTFGITKEGSDVLKQKKEHLERLLKFHEMMIKGTG